MNITEQPVSPEKQRIDLSAEYTASLQREGGEPWFRTFDAIRRQHMGQPVQYVFTVNWEDIPVGKRANTAKFLKAVKGDYHAECTIRMPKGKRAELEAVYDPEFMDCHNALASGVRFEEIE